MSIDMNGSMDYDERSSSVTDIKIEVTDDEIKELSEYFLKSKNEIQKKVDSLLSLELTAARNAVVPQVMAIQNVNALKKAEKSNAIGRPIDLPTATILRELTVGSCVHSFSNDWRRAKFSFREESSEMSYGLLSEKNGSKGFILSVQAVVIKNLIDKGYLDINGKRIQDSEWINKRKILNPNESERKEALIKSLSDILWRAGENKSGCVVQNSQANCFEVPTSTIEKKSNYFADGLTERLYLYDFNEYKALEAFIRKNLTSFQKEDGAILFLYSLILSRNIDYLKSDLQDHTLLGDMEDCKISLFILVFTGVACPYLHNGSIYYDKDGKSLTKPLIGVKKRSDIGILYWDSKEEDDKRTEVGSMLRTPRYPIWLSIMGKNLIAIIFHTSLDLINDWRFEIKFMLNFYSSLKKYETQFRIDIETRDLIDTTQMPLKVKFPGFKFTEEEKEPEIISIIQTKWPNCQILNTDGKDLMGFL